MDVSEHSLRFVLPFSFAPAQAAPVDLLPLAKELVHRPGEEPLESGRLWRAADPSAESKYIDFMFPFFQRFLSQAQEVPKCVMLQVPPDPLQAVTQNRAFEVWAGGQKLPAQVKLVFAGLFLFCTGVGFLVLELEACGCELTTETLAALAWHLRHLRDGEARAPVQSTGIEEKYYTRHEEKRNRTALLKRPSEDRAQTPVPAEELHRSFPRPFLARVHQRRANRERNTYDFPSFTLRDLILFLLHPLLEARQVDGNEWFRKWCLIKRYLIGYHCVRTAPYGDQREKALELFYLRRNYKESYQASDRDLCLQNNPEIVCTFQNITFGQSQEGGAVLVEDTGHPFNLEFMDKARFNYFMPFLLALHQRFALIHFAIAMAELDTEDPQDVRRLRRSVLDFVLKWRFGQVSNITMYNRVYENWRRVLELDPLLQEIKSEVDELDELLERQSRHEEEKRQKTLEITLALLNIVLLPLLLISSIFGMNIREFTGAGWGVFSSEFNRLSLAVLGLYYLAVFLCYWRRMLHYCRRIWHFITRRKFLTSKQK